MSLSDYTTLQSEQAELLASTLTKRDMPYISQFQPIADFEELYTFCQEHPTPITFTGHHSPWRLESVAARTIEAIAIAAHEGLNEIGWETLAQILLEHTEYLYTYPEATTARENLSASSALALASSVCAAIPQSELWQLAGFGRIAASLSEVNPKPSETHITQPLNAAFSLANALNLPILDTANECYNNFLDHNFTIKKRMKFPLSNKDFFHYLNLDFPDLKEVKHAISKNEFSDAMSAYTEFRKQYLRSFEGLSDFERTNTFETAKLYLDCLLQLSINPSPTIYGTTEIAIAAILFPEFRISKQLFVVASRRYQWIIDSCFYPDGFHKDKSFRSHTEAISDFSRFLLAYEKIRHSYQFAGLEEMKKLLEKLLDACLYLCQPDLSFPLIGDDVPYNFDVAGLYKSSNYDQREREPHALSVALPFTGYYVMRNSPNPDAQFLLIDSGPSGKTGSEEKLSFVLYANGRHLITHDHNYENSNNTVYTSRNVILIDGSRQTPKPDIIPDPDTRWITTPVFDFVEGWYKVSDYQHKRSIFYIKGEYFILHDVILGDEEHLIEQCFHLSKISGQTTIPHNIPNDESLMLAPRHSNIFIRSVDTTNVTLKMNGNCIKYQTRSELPVTMNVVLFPLKPYVDQHIAVNTLPVETDSDVLASGFSVKSIYGTDIFLISDDGYARMSTSETSKKIEFEGEYLFLRGDHFVILNGKFLKVENKVIVELDEPRDHYMKMD